MPDCPQIIVAVNATKALKRLKRAFWFQRNNLIGPTVCVCCDNVPLLGFLEEPVLVSAGELSGALPCVGCRRWPQPGAGYSWNRSLQAKS